MPDRNKLKYHAALLDRMANALGVDLQEAALAGQVSINEISDAVLDCSNCPDPAACRVWLDSRSDVAEATPGYCRNADLLSDLHEQVARSTRKQGD